MKDLELTHLVIGAAIDIHRTLGPGLLEAVYEECLAKEFALRGIPYERQKPVPLVYKDLKLECGYRLDFLAGKRVVVEIKSIDAIAPIHETVMLTYLACHNLPSDFLLISMCRFSKTAFAATFGTTKKMITQRRRAPQRLAERPRLTPQAAPMVRHISTKEEFRPLDE